jgi:hypothetical protein
LRSTILMSPCDSVLVVAVSAIACVLAIVLMAQLLFFQEWHLNRPWF